MKRYIILLLAILAATTSCGSDVTDSSSSGTVKKDSNDTAHEGNYLESLVTDVYNGRTLRVFDANDHPEMHVNVALEEQNGDIVNDALYARDLLMEETFGIEVETPCRPAQHRQLQHAVSWITPSLPVITNGNMSFPVCTETHLQQVHLPAHCTT